MTVENILSVDLEDWYHICGVRDRIPEESWPRLESRVEAGTLKILDIFAKRGVKATFFVLGFVAEKHPALVKKIEAAGHEIGLHGYSHRRVYTMTPDMFRQDLKKAVDVVSEIVDAPVKGFRAPEWSIRDDSLWALDILHEVGFAFDSSMAPLRIIGNPAYPKVPHEISLAKGSLWEVPPLVAATRAGNLPIGGGWGLRTLPYGLIRSTIRKLNRQGKPATIFFHPREFIRDVPRLSGLPLVKKIVVGAKIVTAEKRLRQLLNDFRFNTVSSYLPSR